MTPQEAAALLTVAAAYDNRKPDAATAQAWSLALAGLRLEDCQQVVVAHYRRSRDWLMPVDVITGVKRLREKRLTAVVEPAPPPELSPVQTVEWLRDIRRQIADGTYQPAPTVGLERHDVASLGHVGRKVNGARRPAELTTVPVRGAEQDTTEEDA